MKFHTIPIFALLVGGAASAQGGPAPAAGATFDGAASDIQQELEASLAELSALREELAAEMVPLSRQLGELESEYSRVGLELQQTNRLLDSRTLDLSNLGAEIKSRRDETSYLSGLLGDYQRKFESGLHIAELSRPDYEEVLEAARLALENSNLTEQEVFEAQARLIDVSLDRLFEALGGTRFPGSAVNAEGNVERGTFVMVGPAALFLSEDGSSVGTAEQRLGSLEPAGLPFADPEDALAAKQVVASGAGSFPLDPSLGDAHKVEATEQEPFLEHVQKGGAVMIPIFAMAGLALLVALYKWITLSLQRLPSRRQVDELLAAVADRDEELAQRRAGEMRGPVGRMLAAGVDHLREPRELIEEVMYETVLKTRLKLESMLPFIAICAASAPLLGLLGTVTGIISTFKLITVFGSGDVKSLSGGISEALITTKFGLIVAIPSLLLHAFLSRKARGIVARMESAAVALVNQVSRTPLAPAQRPVEAGAEVLEPRGRVEPGTGDLAERAVERLRSAGVTDPELVRAHLRELVDELVDGLAEEAGSASSRTAVGTAGVEG